MPATLNDSIAMEHAARSIGAVIKAYTEWFLIQEHCSPLAIDESEFQF